MRTAGRDGSNPPVRTRLGYLLPVVVSAVVLLALAGIGPAAWLASGHSGLPPQAGPHSSPAPDRAMPLGLRAVPVYRPDGPVPRPFGSGERLPSQAQLDRAIDDAARSLSITQIPQIRSVLSRTFQEGLRQEKRYPFQYPRLDPLVAEALPAELMRNRAAEINDLAVLLILQAAHRRDTLDPAHDMSAAAAYAILNRLRRTVPSCDVQLNLAFLVSTDTINWRAETRTEFERAAELCDDPTPLWLLGQYHIANACSLCELSEAERAEQLDLAAATFTRLQHDHPDVPLGLAGQADLLLRRAEDSQSRRIRPFEARRQLNEAADLYRMVTAQSDDPGLAAGLARAEAGLAHYDEARAVLKPALAAEPRDPVLQTLSVELEEHAGRFAEAARALSSMPPAALPDNTSLLFEPASLIGWPLLVTRVGGVAAAPVELYVTDPPGQGDASVLNYWVIPDFRSAEETRIDGWCRKPAAVRDLLLAGQRQAAAEMVADSRAGDEYVAGRSCHSPLLPRPPHDFRPAVLYAIAAAEAGDHVGRDRWLQEAFGATDLVQQGKLYERRQNLWRFGRDLSQAAAVVEEWITAIPDDPLGYDMRGELAFLRGDYPAAESAFGQALERYRTRLPATGVNDFHGADNLSTRYYLARAQLKLAVSQARADDRHRALPTYQAVLDLTSELAVAGLRGAADDDLIQTRYHALAQRGDLFLADRRYQEAIRSYDEAISLSAAVDQLTPGGEAMLTGAVESNRALALLRAGRAAESVASARQALTRDPDNPIFLEAYASALRETGDVAGAITAYRRALTVDQTLFTAHNNLGVLLARTGQHREAELAFRRSIGANPGYALGWANLGGVLNAQLPHADFLDAQGAWLRATRLEPSLRGFRPGPTLDEAVYASNLDLSRPLPPDWQFTSSSRPPVTGFGILMVLTLIWRVGFGLGLDEVVDRIAQRVLTARPPARPRWRLLATHLHPAIAFAASVLVVLIASTGTLRSAGAAATMIEMALVGVGVMAVLVAFVTARRAPPASRQPGQQFGSPPAVALGLGLSVVQIPFVPVPCLSPLPAGQERARWRGILVLAGVAAALCAVAAGLPAPVLRALAVASVAMTASALLPVRPFDGGFVRRRRSQWLITAAIAAATVVISLSWI